jgi:hypothetical protein
MFLPGGTSKIVEIKGIHLLFSEAHTAWRPAAVSLKRIKICAAEQA